MREGHRPIILGGVRFAPEFPTYWEVLPEDIGGVEALLEGGVLEREPHNERGTNGQFAAPALVPVQPRSPGRPPKHRP